MDEVYVVYVGNGYSWNDEEFAWEVDRIFKNKYDAENYIETNEFDTAFTEKEKPYVEAYELY